jgi:transcriptional regulator with XRE-family HTH domain
VCGGDRRVKGLRREEVAMLAGVSIDYYVRMERGNLSGASDSVLDALAHALQLTLNVYTATPASPTADALTMLASWAATQELTEESLATTDQTGRS